jgi:hypothetical protein
MRIGGVHGRGGSRGPDIASALDDLGGRGVLACDDRIRTRNRRCHILLHSGAKWQGPKSKGVEASQARAILASLPEDGQSRRLELSPLAFKLSPPLFPSGF